MSDIHFGKHEQNQHLFQMNISMKPSKIHLMVIIIPVTEKLGYHKTVNLHHPCQLVYIISAFPVQSTKASSCTSSQCKQANFLFLFYTLVFVCFVFYFLLSLFARQLGYHISHPGSVKKGYQLDKLTMQSSKLLLLFYILFFLVFSCSLWNFSCSTWNIKQVCHSIISDCLVQPTKAPKAKIVLLVFVVFLFRLLFSSFRNFFRHLKHHIRLKNATSACLVQPTKATKHTVQTS